MFLSLHSIFDCKACGRRQNHNSVQRQVGAPHFRAALNLLKNRHFCEERSSDPKIRGGPKEIGAATEARVGPVTGRWECGSRSGGHSRPEERQTVRARFPATQLFAAAPNAGSLTLCFPVSTWPARRCWKEASASHSTLKSYQQKEFSRFQNLLRFSPGLKESVVAS